MLTNATSGNVVQARYSEARLKRYKNNPLIEALPPSLSDEELIDRLTECPDFEVAQREWPTHERMQLVSGLSSFMVPLERHIRLSRTLDGLIREGYVGRAPRTADHEKIFQNIYDKKMAGETFGSALPNITAQLSTALIGISGAGKSTTIDRFLSTIPPVIYHPELSIWQIPYLHIETPHDGVSIKGLAISILRKIDSLIPNANYVNTYAMKSRPSVETLMNHAALVMNIHSVGLLVCDEIQNLGNAPKSKQSLMTLLVSASNELKVPILFVGTNKARDVLGLDFRQARRSIGGGTTYWDRLSDNNDEWSNFLSVLWSYQWIKKPVAYNDNFADVMYHYSQGVIDIAIKLFAACQWRAMTDGSETISTQLISSVASKELSIVMPMIDALRANNSKALESYSDITPPGFEHLAGRFENQYMGSGLASASTKPGHESFAPAVTRALVDVGVDQDKAETMALEIEATGGAKNTLEGVAMAMKALQPLKSVKSKARTFSENINLKDNDLRQAIRNAKRDGTKIYPQLVKLGAVCNLSEVLRF